MIHPGHTAGVLNESNLFIFILHQEKYPQAPSFTTYLEQGKGLLPLLISDDTLLSSAIKPGTHPLYSSYRLTKTFPLDPHNQPLKFARQLLFSPLYRQLGDTTAVSHPSFCQGPQIPT